jgi:serine/threonine-protein kinase
VSAEASSGRTSEELAGIPSVGEVVGGKFAIEKVLGIGGMGVVVAARHVQLGQRVAIKFLRKDAASQPEAVNRFLREARSAVGLQSANVVRVMDVGTLDSGLPYMIMEHLSGSDLGQLLQQRGTLPVEQAVDYVLQAMEAIAEAHAIGIVHRDLKPANLFLSSRPDGSPLVKVLDFGISKAVEAAAEQQSLTATSIVMGSPLYMSPEQLRSSKNVDARTDVWALGVIVYELLSGALPFEADTVTGLCAKIVADPPVPLRARRPDLPVSLEAVVVRCLEKDVNRRPQSVAELAAALKPFATPEGRLAVDRIARIGRPASTPQASVSGAPAPPPASVQSATAYGETVASPASAQSGTAYGETVASWQTSGEKRTKRVMARVAAAVAGLAIAILGIFAFVRSTRAPAAAGPGPSAVSIANDAGATATAAARVSLAPPAPVAPTTPAVASDTSTVAASSPPARPSRPSTSPAARPSAKPAAPASAKTNPDDLLLDRK